MTFEAIIGTVGTAIKFPVFQLFKLCLITPLNLFPTKIYEIFGRAGHGPDGRPDLREYHTVIKGSRRLHAGSALIAHLRGAIMLRHANPDASSVFRGVYTEDFQDIQKKWTY